MKKLKLFEQFILENEDKEYEELDAKAGDTSKKLKPKGYPHGH